MFAEKEKALALAKESIEHRLDQMNELREQINRERGAYISLAVFEAHKERFDTLARIVYVGLGIVVALQFCTFIFMWIYNIFHK